MLKLIQTINDGVISFSHLKNLSMLKLMALQILREICFSHLKNLSMLK